MDISEVMVLLVVGIVVVGPKRLPELMRKAGGYIAKLRRLSTNLRAQSGIDRILREEGLDKEIRELRALKESLSKQAMLDGLVNAVNRPAGSARPAIAASSTTRAALPASPASEPGAGGAGGAAAGGESAAGLIQPAQGAVARGEAEPDARPEPVVRNPMSSFREREYPPYGPDHYEALPDDLEDGDDEQAASEEAAADAEAGAAESEAVGDQAAASAPDAGERANAADEKAADEKAADEKAADEKAADEKAADKATPLGGAEATS